MADAQEMTGGLASIPPAAANPPAAAANLPAASNPVEEKMQEYAKARIDLINQQKALIDSLQSRVSQPADKLMAMSQAFLTPGRTGSFGEAAGNVMGMMKKSEEEENARRMELAKMRFALGQQQLGMAKEDVDLARQSRIQELGKSLYTTPTTGGIPRPNPETLRQMMSVDPEGTMKYLQAQKAVQDITAPRTQKLGAEETVFEQNPDGTWKVVMSGQGKVDTEHKIAMLQLGIDPSQIGSLTAEQAAKLQNQIRINKAGIDPDINEAMTLLGIPFSRINELTPVERAAVEQKILAKKTASAPKTTINMAAETELAKAFAKDEATRLSNQFSTATDAEKLIRTASEMRQLLTGGKVITGPLANITLQANRFVGDPKAVQDTQIYLNQMSAATLAAIKNSNLGSGQGFTNSDRQFLEQAVAGNITWDKVTLQKLADLNEFSARASISRWNDTVKKIPSNILSGLPTVTPVEPPSFNFPKVPGKNVPILSGHPGLFRMQKDSLPPGSPYAVYENGKLQGYLKGKEGE